MRFPRPAVLAFGVLLASPARADPILVEAVVARVDGHAILLSSLRPRLRQLQAQMADVPSWKRSLMLAEARRALLERVIDEQLLAAQARRRSLDVGSAEVDSALSAIAKENQAKPEEILAVAAATGLSERAYRDEISRQLLEQRVLLDEVNRLHLDGSKHSARLWEDRRKALIGRLRRRACIERPVRW